MSTETPMMYDDGLLSLVDMYSTTALEVGFILGIGSSSIAALGGILEEYNDRFESTGDIFSQAFGDAYSYFGNSSHADLVASYNYVQSQGASWRLNLTGASKLLNPIMLDVGVGNIQVYTAIGLLQDYNARFPSTDPLGLKKYNGHYEQLAVDLDSTFNNATVKFASLMVEKGLAWGAENVTNWNTLSAMEKDAFAVYFYNIGEDKAEQKRAEKIAATGANNIDIDNTDIAQEFIMNYANIMERMLPGNERLSALRELIADGALNDNYCFAAGTLIDMADGGQKPIERVVAGDEVVSFDKNGALVAGRVARVFVNRATQLLDFFGTKVTPGHVYLCGDGRFAGQFVTLIDILRSDGAVVRRDGVMIRAATGDVVGSDRDRCLIWAATGRVGAGGQLMVRDARQLRAGTRIITAAGDVCLADLISAAGATVTNDGLICQADGTEAMFHWSMSDQLPLPEDYVLARSQVELSDIYAANEWEGQGPTLPAPYGFRQRGGVQQ